MIRCVPKPMLTMFTYTASAKPGVPTLQFDCGEYNKLLPRDAESPIEGVCSTRALLERTFRRRVLSLPKLTLRAGAPAAGLRLSPDGARVTGVYMIVLDMAHENSRAERGTGAKI